MLLVLVKHEFFRENNVLSRLSMLLVFYLYGCILYVLDFSFYAYIDVQHVGTYFCARIYCLTAGLFPVKISILYLSA